MERAKEFNCVFCKGKCFFRYAMGEYEVWQCKRCGSGQVDPIPGEKLLKEYYDGFAYNLYASPVSGIEASAKKMFLDLKMVPDGGLKMLDVGGGGGFFSKAFENLGYGESTYLDLDEHSCDFARKSLKLKRVFNCDAMDLGGYAAGKFDFIYCRHVIEHLPDVDAFMKNAMNSLSARGIFVMQVPNSSSIEYLAYPWSNLKERISNISRTNNFSTFKVLWIMLTGGMLHGIDPPRHLWAITKKGIKSWARDENVDCKVNTYHLGVEAYSPYYKKGEDLSSKIHNFIGQKLLAPLFGGTHLVAVLRKEANLK